MATETVRRLAAERIPEREARRHHPAARRVLVAVIALLALGGRAATAAAAPRGSAAPAFTIPSERQARADRLFAQILDAARAGDAARFEDLTNQAPRSSSAESRAALRGLRAVAVAGHGVLVERREVQAGVERRTLAYAGPERYHGPATGAWRLSTHVPSTGITRLRQVEATLTLEPAAGVAEVDATITVETGLEPVVLLLVPARHARAELAGQPLPAEVLEWPDHGHALVVERPAGAPTSRLRLRYRLAPPAVVGAREVLVVGRGALLPTATLASPAETPALRLTVDYPLAFTVLAGPGQRAGAAAPGRQRARVEVPPRRGVAVYGAPRYVERVIVVGEVRCRLALWPEHAGQLDLFERAARAALALQHALGPYPSPTLNLVETSYRRGWSGRGLVGHVAFGHELVRRLADGAYRSVVAHEVAHGWFGGRVWSELDEGIVGYLQTLTVTAAEGAWLRQNWSREVNSGRADASRDAFLLTALEDQVGREPVLGLLREVLRRHADARCSRADFLAAGRAVLGAEPARWLERWGTARAAPDLRVDRAVRRGPAIEVTLTQSPAAAATGWVELAFAEGAGPLRAGATRGRVAFGGGRTVVRLAAPPAAREVRLDPDARVLLRYDPARTPAERGHVAPVRPTDP